MDISIILLHEKSTVLMLLVLIYNYIVGNVAKRAKAMTTLKHNLDSTRTLATLLPSWLRRFTMIIFAWRLRTSSKYTRKEGKYQTLVDGVR